MNILVCRPVNFVANEPINIAEKKWFKKGVDKEKLIAEHSEFCEKLKGAMTSADKLIYAKELESCPEQVFTRDIGFDLDKLFVCNMEEPVRKGETEIFGKTSFNGRKIVRMENTVEGGNVITFRDFGKKIAFVGVGIRTKPEAIEELKKKTSFEIIPIRLKKETLHLDCALGVIDESHAFTYKKGIEKEDFKILKQYFNTIEITDKEYLQMGTNIFRLNDTIFCDSTNARLVKILKKLGKKVETLDYSEYAKLGGGLRCSTLEFQKD